MNQPTLYQSLLGDRFAMLPAELQKFHGAVGQFCYQGTASVAAADHPLTRLTARLLGLPVRSAEVGLQFMLDANADQEIWTRNFSGQVMRSRLRARDGLLYERLGIVMLQSRLEFTGNILRMHILGVRVFGVPVPAWTVPHVVAEETASHGQLHFNIHVSWGRLGRLASYRGHLQMDSATVIP